MRMGSAYSDNFMDALSILSFLIGIANYDENLSQSDKDDMMKQLDEKTNVMLERLEADLEYQNRLLEEQTELLHKILTKLEG